MLNHLLNKDILKFCLLFAIIFVGDYTFLGLYLSPLILVTGLFFVVLMEPERFRLNLWFGGFLLISSSVLLVLTAVSGIDRFYSFWPVLALLGFFVIGGLSSINYSRVYFLILFLAILFLGLQIIWLESGGVRGRAVFGPNVLYRIYGFFLIGSLLYFRRLKLCAIFFVCCLGILLTGSRGGAFILLSLSFVWCFMNFRSALPYILVFATIGVVNIDYFDFVIGEHVKFIFYRLANLSIDSLGDRGIWIASFWNFLDSESWALLRGVGLYPNEVFSFYPHNFMLEIIVGYGVLFGGGVVVVILSALVFGMVKFSVLNRNQRSVYLLFLLFVISSNFSGSLLDNWPVVSLGALVLQNCIGVCKRWDIGRRATN